MTGQDIDDMTNQKLTLHILAHMWSQELRETESTTILLQNIIYPYLTMFHIFWTDHQYSQDEEDMIITLVPTPAPRSGPQVPQCFSRRRPEQSMACRGMYTS